MSFYVLPVTITSTIVVNAHQKDVTPKWIHISFIWDITNKAEAHQINNIHVSSPVYYVTIWLLDDAQYYRHNMIDQIAWKSSIPVLVL